MKFVEAKLSGAFQIELEPHRDECASGALWNDPAFGLEWPLEPSFISSADQGWAKAERSPFAGTPAT